MFKESKTRKTVGLVIGIIGSLFLIFSLVTTPLYKAFFSIFDTDNLATIIKNVDYSDVIEKNIDINTENKEAGEIVNTVMHSEVVNDVLDLYLKDLNNASLGMDTTNFSEAAIKDILVKNSASLVDELDKNPNINLSRDEIQTKLNDVIENNSDDIVKMLPSVNDMNQVFNENDMSFAAFNMSGTMTITMFLMFIIVATIGIFVAKLYRLKGLIILGVDYLVGAIITFAFSALVGMQFLVDELNGEVMGMGDILTNMSNEIRTWSIVFVILSVVFFIVGIVGGKMCKKVELARNASNPYENTYNNNAYNNTYNNAYNNNTYNNNAYNNNAYNNAYNNSYNNNMNNTNVYNNINNNINNVDNNNTIQ